MDKILEKINSGEVATGSHIQIANMVATDIISRSGFDMLWIDTEHGPIDTMDYIHNVSRKIWKIVQIEHIDAVRCLDEILEIPGLDAIIVGSNDLSGSIGLLGQTMHPEVMKLEEMIAEAAHRHNKLFGVSMGWIPEKVRIWKERGASFIFVGSDVSYLAEGAKDMYKCLVACVCGSVEESNGKSTIY